MKNLSISAILLFAFLKASAQIVVGVEPIVNSKIKFWPATSPKEYTGSYHFGESEAESELILIVKGNAITARVKSGEWKGDTWRTVYKSLTNVKIVGNKFYSTQTNGEFVRVQLDDETVYGLKIDKPWSLSTPKGHKEIGVLLKE